MGSGEEVAGDTVSTNDRTRRACGEAAGERSGLGELDGVRREEPLGKGGGVWQGTEGSRSDDQRWPHLSMVRAFSSSEGWLWPQATAPSGFSGIEPA